MVSAVPALTPGAVHHLDVDGLQLEGPLAGIRLHRSPTYVEDEMRWANSKVIMPYQQQRLQCRPGNRRSSAGGTRE